MRRTSPRTAYICYNFVMRIMLSGYGALAALVICCGGCESPTATIVADLGANSDLPVFDHRQDDASALSKDQRTPDKTIADSVIAPRDTSTSDGSLDSTVQMNDLDGQVYDSGGTPDQLSAAVCGNGIVDPGETCDIALTGSCSTSCSFTTSPCIPYELQNAGTCQAQCVSITISACADNDGCCPSGCTRANDNNCLPDCSPKPGTPTCGGAWIDADSGSIMKAGLGLREPGVDAFYGSFLHGGTWITPQCAHLTGEVTVPVIMIDWADFDPATQPSNENNAQGSLATNYTQATPTEFSTYLNSTINQYFSDISGQKVKMKFKTYGWLKSNAAGYFKDRSHYTSEYQGKWQCDRIGMATDAMRQAVVDFGLDFTQYDADCNGVVDAVVVIYEGIAGLCNGTNVAFFPSSASATGSPPSIHLSQWADELVDATDPNYALFKDQHVALTFYSNMPERSSFPVGEFSWVSTWAHELGHIFWGYLDYYLNGFEVKHYMLSGNLKAVGWHPSALEKWLFGQWIQPQTISSSGTYTLAANEIADGSTYDSASTYLYTIYPYGSTERFLTIEARWLSDETNAGSSWAPTGNARESGLVIFEVDRTKPYYPTTTPQLFRHAPAREQSYPVRAFRPGDVFNKCFSAQCVTITPLNVPGATASFQIDLSPAAP
jgi:hypothetical protein